MSDLQLGDGTNRLFDNKLDARNLLQKAVDRYQTVLSESREADVRQRALWGLGRAHESQGELEKAAEDYGKLVKQWPQGVFSDAAAHRQKEIEKLSIREFYDWFAKAEPKRPETNRPGFSRDSLEEFDLGTPGSGDFLKQPAGEFPKPGPVEEGATETPATDAPESETPATEKAATESPAAEPAKDAAPAESAAPAPESGK